MIENITSSGRRRRLAQGFVLSSVALGTTIYLIRKDAIAAWFVMVFALILLAAMMFLQARDKT